MKYYDKMKSLFHKGLSIAAIVHAVFIPNLLSSSTTDIMEPIQKVVFPYYRLLYGYKYGV